MQNRVQHALDAVLWAERYVTTVGPDSILHVLILLQPGPEQQRGMWSVIRQAIKPMVSRLQEHGAASIDLHTKLALAGLAVDKTIPVLKELGINLPAWRRAALLKDYEHLLEFLMARATNVAGAPEPEVDEQYGP